MQVPSCACASGTAANRNAVSSNVRAAIYNNGNLFWRGGSHLYEVPKGSGANAIFASGIWLGGLDDSGNIRFTGTTSGPFEYWPGPLDANGNASADCSVFDRIWKITGFSAI